MARRYRIGWVLTALVVGLSSQAIGAASFSLSQITNTSRTILAP